MSKMSLKDNDDYSYDTKDDLYRIGGKSVTFSGVDSFVGRKSGCSFSASKSESVFPVALPFIVDYWYNLRGKKRASIQVQMLSASKDLLRLVSYRVSSSQKEFVVLCPVSKYLGVSERSHFPYILSKLPTEEKTKQKEILKWHPKVNARNLNVKEKQKKMEVM